MNCEKQIILLMISNEEKEGWHYLKVKNYPHYRSSRPEVFCKRGVLRNFAKFTGKHLRQSLFFNKVEHLRWLLLALLRGVTSKHGGDFYCLKNLHSFRTENKLKNMMVIFIA